MAIHYDGEVRIVKVNMGPYNNNGYIVTDPETKEGVIIDAPAEPEKLLGKIGETKIIAILITHGHRDHVLGYTEIRQAVGAPIYVHPDDAHMMPEPAEHRVFDGDIIRIGKTELKVMHTPGHTAGGICLLTGQHLFSGDTLFPGGPGKTSSPEGFRQLKESINGKLLPLLDNVAVYPGHGIDTSIEQSRREIMAFDSKFHPPNLYGDITWGTA